MVVSFLLQNPLCCDAYKQLLTDFGAASDVLMCHDTYFSAELHSFCYLTFSWIPSPQPCLFGFLNLLVPVVQALHSPGIEHLHDYTSLCSG